MHKLSSIMLIIALVLFGCGGSDDTQTGEVADTDFVHDSPIDQVLVPEQGQVVSQFVDAVAEGVPYKSDSGVGSTCEGKTSALGQFITYPGGKTEFRIGNVNLGTWYEPNQSNRNGSIVQLRQLSYGQTTCSSLNPTTTAQILLGLNAHPNFFHVKIPDNQTLFGCPQESNFLSQNNINVTTQQASDHTSDTSNRIDVKRQIAYLLFGIDTTIDNVGVDDNYNNFGAPRPSNVSEGGCNGYVGGHAGVDFLTKDAAKAERDVYSLTDGEVVDTNDGNGRVTVRTMLNVDGANEEVKLIYLHLRPVSVTKGTIKKGEKIGVQGNKGVPGVSASDTTSKRHVHLEIRSGTASDMAACGASSSLDPHKYFAAIVGGGATPRWIASMANYGIAQELEFESFLPEGDFTATGRETLVSGTCALTSELSVSGRKNGRSLTLKTSTITTRKGCQDGTLTSEYGFERNYVGEYLGDTITITSVDQCDFLYRRSNPYECFNFMSFNKQ